MDNVLKYSEDENGNATSVVETHNKLNTHTELVSMLYIVGIIGSLLALLHLCQKQNLKNSKQAFMLKFLMTLDFVGLMGMLSQLTIRSYLDNDGFYKDHIWLFCFIRLVWRFFGLSSGCVAFIMAIERYFALTKPFFYCKHFTNGLIKRLIIMMWASCALLTFVPVLGFGIFCDMKNRKCQRYRDAEHPLDVTYAFLFFFVGMLHN
ncbi:CLUMA_CG017303, isoform A [Clunio marinus]|uniref:CLUMA_CG017303, isoform A n=1 Tax=Clunio marinus TaxID=568069 RepID=A0A1J1IX98_9DIPT|nr:CLUMA_CG017303, isoform A [Clunio marinus]